MCVIIFKIELGVSAPPRHSEERTEPTHMGDVRDVESPAWNDYLVFFSHSELAEESSEA